MKVSSRFFAYRPEQKGFCGKNRDDSILRVFLSAWGVFLLSTMLQAGRTHTGLQISKQFKFVRFATLQAVSGWTFLAKMLVGMNSQVLRSHKCGYASKDAFRIIISASKSELFHILFYQNNSNLSLRTLSIRR